MCPMFLFLHCRLHLLYFQGVEHYDDVGENTSAVLPVDFNSVYNITVRAKTSAGYGDWSEPLLFNTSLREYLSMDLSL